MLERVHRRPLAGAGGAADEGNRLERWCDPALYLVQLLAFLAALVTIEGYEDTGGPSLVRILAVGCIALLPHLIGGTREPGTSPRRRAIVLLLALGLQLLLLAVLAQRSPVGLATGLTLAMVAWLGVRTREDALALMGVVSLVAVPGTASLVLICVQLFACVLALLLVHGRAARRLGARAPGGTRLLEDSRRSMLMRLRYAALLSLALLLGTIFMQGLLQSAHTLFKISGRCHCRFVALAICFGHCLRRFIEV